MPFVKGQSGNPGGRPKGQKNKVYLSLTFWFEIVAENAKRLLPKEKIEIAFRAINVLAPKVPNLPSEQGDSVSNALRTQEILQKLEVKNAELPPMNPGESANAGNNA